MQRLLAFIEQNLYLILFLIFQGFCATLLFRLNPYQRAYFSNVAGDVTARVNNVSSSITHYFNLGEQNRILQSTIADSILHFNSNLQLHFLNDTFTVSDSLKRPWFDIIPAQVVYNSIHKSENYFVINKGSKDGINKGSGVISPRGVAGIIIAVGPRFSTAMSLLNVDFKLLPQINGQEYFTDIVWDYSKPHSLEINKINRLEKIKPGDLVSTGKSSLIFPPGLPLGYLQTVKPVEGGQYFETEFTPATDFRRLNYVFVLHNKYQEQIENILP